jgi:hypothetical protein
MLQETELRTLKAAAEEVASKFDATVAALAAKRLDMLAEVSRLLGLPDSFKLQASACMRFQFGLMTADAAFLCIWSKNPHLLERCKRTVQTCAKTG